MALLLSRYRCDGCGVVIEWGPDAAVLPPGNGNGDAGRENDIVYHAGDDDLCVKCYEGYSGEDWEDVLQIACKACGETIQ